MTGFFQALANLRRSPAATSTSAAAVPAAVPVHAAAVPMSAAAVPSSAAAVPERSARAALLDAFLQASHGRLSEPGKLHLDAVQRDPLFYGPLARWYMDRGCIRDHQELFVVHLLASRHMPHRVHGRVLMQRLRAYQVARVIRYARQTLHAPLRPLKRAVEAWLRRREAWHEWFDECAIRDRHALKGLYASLHIKPSERAEQILFQDAPPADSRVAHARRLGQLSDDPAAQARLIVAHHIHYTTAVGAIKHYTPMVLFALASVMTAPQIISNLALLKRRGAFDHPETRQLLDQRIREAVKDARVSDFKAVVALREVGYDAPIARGLLRTTEERLRNRGTIDRPTAILVDKSASMDEAVELGKLLAILCSTVARSTLQVFAFDSAAFPIRPRRPDIRGWEEAFAPVRADGCTSIGSPLRLLGKVDQIVVITDGEENTAPMFSDALAEYERRHGVVDRIVVIRLRGQDGPTPLEQNMRHRPMTVIPFRGDYYNLPNIVPMLCNSPQGLVDEILACPLYAAEDMEMLPAGYDEATHEIL